MPARMSQRNNHLGCDSLSIKTEHKIKRGPLKDWSIVCINRSELGCDSLSIGTEHKIKHGLPLEGT